MVAIGRRWVPSSTPPDGCILVCCGDAARPDCRIDPRLDRMAARLDARTREGRGCLGIRVEDLIDAGKMSKSTFYEQYHDVETAVGAIVECFSREFALHLTSLRGRREEPAVRQMCASVGPGGGRMRHRLVAPPPRLSRLLRKSRAARAGRARRA